MELVLNIKNGNELIKTYKADTINFSFGIIEDVLDAIDPDNLKNADNFAKIGVAIKIAKQVKPFLKDMFPGLTDDELRSVGYQDIFEIFECEFKYAMNELGTAVGPEKN